MTNDTCTVEGCESPAWARGWCRKHYSRWYTHGDPLKLSDRTATPVPVCTVEGCAKVSDSHGLCTMHYARKRRHGDVTVNLRPRGRNSTADTPVACREDGCDRHARTFGLCGRHYRAKLRAERGPCSVDGCETPWHASGWCLTHYHRMRSHGVTDDPAAAPLLGACRVDQCPDAVKARGLCSMHLRRWYRTGSTDTPITTGTRTCRRCRQTLPADAVTKTSLICISCRPAWAAERRAKVLPRTKAVRQRAAELHAEQDGRCAICHIEEAEAPKSTLHVDHIHGTEIIRGLLCANCNLALGLFQDDPVRMRAAIAYLRRTTA